MAVLGSTFGERLKVEILARYPSLRAFAREVKMEPTYLSRIINGHVDEPERGTLQRFADALDMELDALQRRTGLAARPAQPVGEDDPLADVFAWMRQQPDIVEDFADAKRRMTTDVYAEYVRQTATAWASNARMQKRTWELAEQSRDRAE